MEGLWKGMIRYYRNVGVEIMPSPSNAAIKKDPVVAFQREQL